MIVRPLKSEDIPILREWAARAKKSGLEYPDPEHPDIEAFLVVADDSDRPILAADGRTAPYSRIVAAIDNSGRGADETAIAIIGELNGNLYLLAFWASRGGFEPATLIQLAKLCVQYRVNDCRIESNFGDGMFAALFQPVLTKAWEVANRGAKEPGGTAIEEVRTSNLLQKERRILSVLEPVTQQHRLVVARSAIEWDLESISKIEGEDGRHRYSLFHQFTHITRERECLTHEDRLDALSMAVGAFGELLGVDPGQQAIRRAGEAEEEEWERLFGPDQEEDELGILKGKPKVGQRPKAAGVQQR